MNKMYLLLLLLLEIADTECKLVKLIGENYMMGPIEIAYNWVPATVAELNCPSIRWTPDNVTKVDAINVNVLSDQHYHATVNGEACHKLEYSVICDKGFFGGETITKKISYPEITQRECIEAIARKTRGLIDQEPYFPAKDCTWMSTEISSKVFIVVSDHKVHEDPYTATYIDPIFVGGSCKDNMCGTIKSSIYWITEKTPQEGCPLFIGKLGNLKKTGTGHYYLYIKDTPVIDLQQTCTMNFCGVRGYVTTTGIFIKTWGSFENKGQCSSDTKVHAINDITISMEHSLSEDKIKMRELCFETLMWSRLNNKVSSITLARMTPLSSGTGHIYRIREGQLEKMRVKYEMLTGVYYDKEDDDSLLLVFRHMNFTHKSPVKTGNGDERMWYNGMTINKGIVVIPQIEILKDYVSDSLRYIHSLDIIEHPSKKILSNTTSEGTEESRSKTHIEISRAFEAFTNWLKSGWNKLIFSAVFIIVIIGLVLICVCFSTKCANCLCSCIIKRLNNRNSAKKNKKKEEEERNDGQWELRSLTTG